MKLVALLISFLSVQPVAFADPNDLTLRLSPDRHANFADTVHFSADNVTITLLVHSEPPNLDKCAYDGPTNTDNFPSKCAASVIITRDGHSVTKAIAPVCSIVGNSDADPRKVGVFATFDRVKNTLHIFARSDAFAPGQQSMCDQTIHLNL